MSDIGTPSGTTAGTSWSVDPTLHFDHIHIIESLNEPGRARRTGQRLFDEMETLCPSPARMVYHAIADKAQLRSLLLALVNEANAGHFPIVHIEAHGENRAPGQSTTSRGIVLASGELMAWSELAPYLVEINRATRLQLIVFIATCFGADVTTLVEALDRAPARILIGPKDEISTGTLETGTFTFYRSLFAIRNGTQALIDMNRATGGAFFRFTAEWLFLHILKGYFNEHTSDRAAAIRAERIVAPLALAGRPAAEIGVMRREMIKRFQDRQAVFDAAYQKFFFVDEHPEFAGRFVMSYEMCFTSSTATDG